MSGDWGVLLVAGTRFGGSPPLGDWQLARALASRRPTLFVEAPLFLHRTPALPRWPAAREAAPGLSVVRPVAPPGANRLRYAALADRVLDAQLRRSADTILGPRRVTITFDPRRGELRGVPADATVYWRRDRLAARPRRSQERAHVAARDRRLMLSADLVTGVSPPLVEEATALGARAVLVPNGVDVEHFASPAAPPSDAPVRDARPVLGFAGGLNHRVDLDLLAGIADARPGWIIVLVGEVLAPPPRRPNVIAVGRRSYTELPGWLQRFDVGLVPYRTDPFNVASSPLKVYEYLAAGRPVVSTPLPALDGLAPYVRTAADVAGFVGALEAAMADGPSGDACLRIAAANSWDTRVRLLEACIDQVLGATQPSRRRDGSRPISR